MNKAKEMIQAVSWNKIDTLAPPILLLLILVLCWKLASIFWWIVAPPQVIQAEKVMLGSQQAQIPNISSFSLFQEVGKGAEGADANLEIQLQGVMVSQPNHLSSAVIKVKDIADRYLIGEKLEGSSYELAEVYWDHIVLRHGSGSLREVKFVGIENLNQPMTLEEQPNSVKKAPQPPQPQMNQSQNQNQNALGQAIGQIEENREQYLKNMGINTSGGNGYEVSEQTPPALRNKLGLKTGDRILSLNGQTVGQGQTEAQLLEQVKKEGKVRIEVKRGDQVMTFEQDL